MNNDQINLFTLNLMMAYLKSPEHVASGCIQSFEKLIRDVRDDSLRWHEFLSRVELIAKENRIAYEMAILQEDD
ncbi:hypothetical protein [Roseateles sp. PN1]|uniref:hypothetical protein n=1 Tax=Roseateles sp. PN1 TaxID=3137372 RepID=UPI00313988D7